MSSFQVTLAFAWNIPYPKATAASELHVSFPSVPAGPGDAEQQGKLWQNITAA